MQTVTTVGLDIAKSVFLSGLLLLVGPKRTSQKERKPVTANAMASRARVSRAGSLLPVRRR